MRSVLLSVVALLLVFASVATAETDTCKCLNGGARTVSSDLPSRCECSCAGDYQPPTCKYLSTESVGVLYKFLNTTATPYKATGLKIKSLLEHFGYSKSTTGIIRLNRRLVESEPSNHSIVYALMSMASTQADRFVRDFDKVGAKDSFYTAQAVLEVNFYEAPAASPSELAQSTLIGGSVPWAGISWIVGTVIMLIAFPIMECILGSVCSGSTFCTD